jgi:TPP-dependent pyruvate/acetoin dehydrogenase alpha subunit
MRKSKTQVVDQPDDIEFYRMMYRIRRFEETVLENFPKGIFMGTTHTYLGQEANAAALLSRIHPQDIVFSNHRCHGHFLVYGGDLRALFAELMGRASGVCGGRGGSQHLHWRNFYSNGIQGGIVPLATGMALAEKRKGSGVIAIAFLGDGTFGEGILYESFNLASLWEAPILYVVENNHIAQTTPIELALTGDLQARFNAFGIPSSQLDSSDVKEIYLVAQEMQAEVRQRKRPAGLILSTCRFGPHSKGDDTRAIEQIERLRLERDPLKIQATRLHPQDRVAVEGEIEAEVSAAFQQALGDPWPDLTFEEIV